MKVLLKRFHLNGNTIGFDPQTQKLELHTNYIVPCERPAKNVSFEWSQHKISSAVKNPLKFSLILLMFQGEVRHDLTNAFQTS